MNHSLVIQLLAMGIVYGTPLLLAALGELLTERSGVINIGIEGMMLMGAVSGFWISQLLGGPSWIALAIACAGAAAVGGLTATIHAFMTITMRADQIVSGFALMLLGGAVGLSTYIGEFRNLGNQPSHHTIPPINVFGLQNVPILGPLIFHQNALVYVSWLAILAVSFYIYRTHPGLRLRAVGDNPKTADAMGISVARCRYLHTIAGGCFAGVAGAYYSLVIARGWTDGMTDGAGFIALALVIFSFWRPGRVLVGAYLFGTVASVAPTLQARGVRLPPEYFNALPYVMTIVVLVILSTAMRKRYLGSPAALGSAYSREDT